MKRDLGVVWQITCLLAQGHRELQLQIEPEETQLLLSIQPGEEQLTLTTVSK